MSSQGSELLFKLQLKSYPLKQSSMVTHTERSLCLILSRFSAFFYLYLFVSYFSFFSPPGLAAL